jgi:hypothetical protein
MVNSRILGIVSAVCGIIILFLTYRILGKKISFFKDTMGPAAIREMSPLILNTHKQKVFSRNLFYLSGSTTIVLGLLLIIFMPDIFDKSDDKDKKEAMMT